jgi:hypothetical protein
MAKSVPKLSANIPDFLAKQKNENLKYFTIRTQI